MMIRSQHGAAGCLGVHVPERVTMDQERDWELVKPTTARFLIRVLVNLSKLNGQHAMMIPVLLGLIGPAGMIAMRIVMVEFNWELGNAKMETKMIVQDHQLTSNNVTDNHVNLMVQWSTGKTIRVIVVGLERSGSMHGEKASSPIPMENPFPIMKHFSINVSHIVYRTTAALLPKLLIGNGLVIM